MFGKRMRGRVLAECALAFAVVGISTVGAPAAVATVPDLGLLRVALDYDQAPDPVAARVVGGWTFVLDSGLHEPNARGALRVESGVHRPQPYERVIDLDAGGGPAAFDIDPTDGDGYVVEEKLDRLLMTSGHTGTVSKEMNLSPYAQHPDSIGVDAEANLAYIGDDGTGNVVVLNLDDWTVITTIHPPLPSTGVTSIVVDTQRHEAWAGARGGAVYLLGLGNNGVTTMGVAYHLTPHSGNDPTSLALVNGIDGTMHAVWVSGRHIDTVTDAAAFDQREHPQSSGGASGWNMPAGVIATGITIDPVHQTAYVLAPAHHEIVSVDLGGIETSCGSYPFSLGLSFLWTFPIDKTVKAAVANFDNSGQVLVVGDSAGGTKPGFLQIEEPLFWSYPFPADC